MDVPSILTAELVEPTVGDTPAASLRNRSQSGCGCVISHSTDLATNSESPLAPTSCAEAANSTRATMK